MQWFIGINQRDSDQEVGFLHYLEISDTDGASFKGNLEIIRSWKESSDASHLPSVKNQYPAMFELRKILDFLSLELCELPTLKVTKDYSCRSVQNLEILTI